MELIHGNGVPGKNTAGSLGDIYVDDRNDQHYKCSLAIKISGSDGFEYEWKKMKTSFSHQAGKEVTGAAPYTKQKSEKRPSNAESTSACASRTEQPTHKNYTQYSKKNKGER